MHVSRAVRRSPDPRPLRAALRLVSRGRDAARARRLRAEHRLRPRAARRAAPALRHGGARRGRRTGTGSRAEGVDVSGLPSTRTSSRRRSSSRPTEEQNQIASFYTGAMARARRALTPLARRGTPWRSSSSRPTTRRRWRATRGVPRARAFPFLYDPSQQVARLTGEELLAGPDGRLRSSIVNDYEFGILTHKTGLSREEIEARVPVVVVTHGPDGSTIAVTCRGRPRVPRCPRRELETEAVDPDRASGTRSAAGLIRGLPARSALGGRRADGQRRGRLRASRPSGRSRRAIRPERIPRPVRAELRHEAAWLETACSCGLRACVTIASSPEPRSDP